jgi:hypothetical protein
MRDQIDPEAQGGAYLLGLRALMVVPHGRFGRRGFERAIVRAAEGARQNLVAHTGEALQAAGALRQAPLAGAEPPAGAEPREPSAGAEPREPSAGAEPREPSAGAEPRELPADTPAPSAPTASLRASQ